MPGNDFHGQYFRSWPIFDCEINALYGISSKVSHLVLLYLNHQEKMFLRVVAYQV